MTITMKDRLESETRGRWESETTYHRHGEENGEMSKQDEDSDDPNQELEEAYQKVEQTLADQQFGASSSLHASFHS